MRTESFKVLQAFGYESPYYKILVQARSGNRYFVWYIDSIGVEVGQELLINFDGDYWRSINNPQNGKKSNIAEVSKVN